jgi:hypothetical protein
MRIAGTMLAAAALLSISACKGPGSVQAANARVAQFHQRLDAGDYDAIWRDSGPDIQGTTSQPAFIEMLATIHVKLGNVRESKQTGWRSEVNTSGSVAELTMQTTFERGSGVETFVYKGGTETQKLAGYHINSNDLMK